MGTGYVVLGGGIDRFYDEFDIDADLVLAVREDEGDGR
jgi:hypothetical protein